MHTTTKVYMAKKMITKKVDKRDQETVSLKPELINIIRPFFDLGYPARKTSRQTLSLDGKTIKMASLKTVIKYYSIWKMEHTYAQREDLSKHQRNIKSELVDQYEEIILRSARLYSKAEDFIDNNKEEATIDDYYWYPKMIQQLTDHNTLLGELIASKARLEMAPYIDQTSEDAIKKKLEHDIEEQSRQMYNNKKQVTEKSSKK